MATQDKDFHNIDDLSRKVNSEYEAFIDDMKTQPPEKIIEAAYEITWKDSINQFIANEDVMLSYSFLPLCFLSCLASCEIRKNIFSLHGADSVVLFISSSIRCCASLLTSFLI